MKQTNPSDRLREARKAAGFASAAEAARRIGISPITYTAHENGTRDYDRKTCLAYARKFRVSAAWLMFGDDAATMPKQEIEDAISVVDFRPKPGRNRLLSEYDSFDRMFIEDFEVDTMRLPKSMLTKKFETSAENLFVMEWLGSRSDSQSNLSFRAGDFLIFDLDVSRPPLGEFYLIAGNILPELRILELKSRSDDGELMVRVSGDESTPDGSTVPYSSLRIIGRLAGCISANNTYH